MAVRDRVKRLIKTSGLKQKAVAERIGETPYWLSDRLTGRVQFLADELPRIAEALQVRVDDLFDAPSAPSSTRAVPPAFTEAFEHEGAEHMLSDYLQLQALTPYESAIVSDLVESLKRNRPQLSA